MCAITVCSQQHLYHQSGVIPVIHLIMKCILPILVAAIVLLPSCSSKIVESGRASYYADKFNGRKTANGEVFRQRKKTAAHKTLPFGTKVTVRNLTNGRSVKVRINDRGPFVKGRSIDLSKRAARKLGMLKAGVVDVELRYKKP